MPASTATNWSAVDRGHVGVVVPLPRGRLEIVQAVDLVGGELDGVGGDVLPDPGHAACAGDRGDVLAAAQQPGQRGLGGVVPLSAPMALTSSTMARLRQKFSPVNRGLVVRQSSSAKSSTVRI